ncbi:toll/interleukin-1 receptor domain-containing protein [Mucilaginibacter rubeus]|uniref:Toll/interleukin-1 receptor domain-containing protein n=1 Tax=Mucilaginibacter rubeus TaxID=2027860 RepID=A0A5C1I534_9SPHI|nr:toll/interleukin-1 receptor domain-containing protein [Mucilaginibacter rubeus]QEM13029.1 toll/interleukin-1 receptor domain-containing protein [Mucilaginibacter rubeus]
MSILTFIKKIIFGYDIFVSYSRLDGLNYAYAVAQHFLALGYECYIDQLSSSAPGEKLPLSIRYAVKRSTSFVLIGSGGAQNSVPIADEIKLFLENNKNLPLIPITIDGAINGKAIWYKQIAGLALIDDSIQNLSDGIPAPAVLERIKNALKFTKKSVRLRNITLAILAGIIIISAIAGYYSYIKTLEAKRAIDDKEKATVTMAKALRAKRVADLSKSEADSLRKEADSARGIALRDKDFAQHLADSARHEAEKSGLIAKSNYLINLSNNFSNKYFALDTALKAIKLNPTSSSENNLIQLFLKYPFVYGTDLHYLDIPNKLLSRKQNLIYYLDGSIKQHDITNPRQSDVVKQKIEGYPNIIKDSIILVFNGKQVIKHIVHALSNTVGTSKINFDPPVYLSGANLLNGRIIHEQGNFGKPIDNTIKITEYNGKSLDLITVPLGLSNEDKIENTKMFYSDSNYFLAVELAANDKDISNKEVRIVIYALTEKFQYIGKNMISIGKVLFPNYDFTDFNDIVRYTDDGDTLLLLFFNQKICRYSLTENRERNGIKVSQDSYVEDRAFIPEKNVMVVKNGPNLIVEYLKDLERSDPFSTQSYVVTLPENGFSFLVAGDYILILTQSGCFYVLDIKINPNVPNNYLPVDEILETRAKSRGEFFKYILSN